MSASFISKSSCCFQRKLAINVLRCSCCSLICHLLSVQATPSFLAICHDCCVKRQAHSFAQYHWPITEQEKVTGNELETNVDFIKFLASNGLRPHITDNQPCLCGRLGGYVPVQVSTPTVYFDAGTALPMPMFKYTSTCGRKECELHYDGHKDGLFVYSTKSAFSGRLLYKYGFQYELSGLPLETHHAGLRAAYKLLPSASK
jgi:hypothetical protein